MASKALLGTWRLVSLTRSGGAVITDETHLVVRPEQLWEVRPRSTYYEGEPGPESEYRVTWKGAEGRLEVLRPPRPSFCAIVRRSGDELRVRWGGVVGHFPKSIDDEHGLLAVFVVESDPTTLAKVSEPPPRVKRTTRRHRTLGELQYEDRLSWWTAKVRWGGKEVTLHVSGAKDCGDDLFDRAASRLKAVRCNDLKAYAASKLLALKNGSWLGDDEKPVSATTFRARLAPESFSVDDDGHVNVCFEDGDLFWGHVILVDLDDELKPRDAEIAG